MEPLRVDGKFFRSGESRIAVRAVTYGPFPGGFPEDFSPDFARIRVAGFNALRLYEMPSPALLDAALAAGLRVFGGLRWPQAVDFLKDGRILSSARVALAEGLRAVERHPSLAGIFIANEVPADLVRWMGPVAVREALEDLIAAGKEIRPDLLWCYGNYPSTEYLEPANADFTAFNVYLEDEASFRKYLRRLHHIAGDRPLLISEFGLDSSRNSPARQAEILAWAIRAAREEGAAGMTVYAWSDRWWNAGMEVLDWDFGLIDRGGHPKPALEAVTAAFAKAPPSPPAASISVIVCTRNGSPRIAACLRALEKQTLPAREVIVVDDGSTDGTADLVERGFPLILLLRLEPGGLSAARNAGAEAATGEFVAFTDDDCEPDPDWLAGLAECFAHGWDAAGGPNLPPPPHDAIQAVVAAAPGAPSHVMLDDEEAEHLPGCNIAVRRTAYFEIGGFDPIFRTAGDDVDFCWRLREKGYRLGFAPTAFVWHHRRPSLRTYLRQQIGYGKAEALLIAKHPARFTANGDARWEGFVYSGGPVRVVAGAIIYHGPMGLAGYQGVVDRMQPLRPLDVRYHSLLSRSQLALVSWLQPRLRSLYRCHAWRGQPSFADAAAPPPDREFSIWSQEGRTRDDFLAMLLEQGWQAAGANDRWDLEKDGSRLLLATERTDGTGKSVLVRAWGDPPAALAAAVNHP
ncbi:glycosyltransferase [Haloferula sp. BvORR071]|uniref:glycosyltransferase family 2 protein n=1 Tax=Haloferula sp. BvORR071 TaxID=1396141 RepID=UPI000698D75B|nr:glycosyltransferase [Haloferula sp. BvORR071]